MVTKVPPYVFVALTAGTGSLVVKPPQDGECGAHDGGAETVERLMFQNPPCAEQCVPARVILDSARRANKTEIAFDPEQM